MNSGGADISGDRALPPRARPELKPSNPEAGALTRKRWLSGWPTSSRRRKQLWHKSKSSQSKHFMTRPKRGGPAPHPSHVTPECAPAPSTSASSASVCLPARGLRVATSGICTSLTAPTGGRSARLSAACNVAVVCWRPSSWRCNMANSRTCTRSSDAASDASASDS